MAIPEDRLSTELVDDTYIDPEGFVRLSFLHDREGGPIGLTDTTEGMNYQDWELTYVGNNITLTPLTVGSPIVPVIAADVRQASFCFDQNARPSVVYLTETNCFLYWYDSTVANYVTTEFPGYVSGMLSLDDKRDMQVGVNDILFWYTKEVSPNEYWLYHRKQRDRFETEYLMREDPNTPMPVPPYMWKAGMHEGLRGKVTLTYRTPGA